MKKLSSNISFQQMKNFSLILTLFSHQNFFIRLINFIFILQTFKL